MSIVLKTDGKIYLEEYNEDETKESFINPEHILFYLNEDIILQEKFTLRSFFKMVDLYDKFLSFHVNFIDYLNESKKISSETKRRNDIDFLSLMKVGSYGELNSKDVLEIFDKTEIPDKEKILDKEELLEEKTYKQLDFIVTFSGKNIKSGYYEAIEFLPLEEIIDIPVKIENNMLFINSKDYVGDYYDITLFEFIMGIIEEIAFCGSPEEKVKQYEKFKDIIEDFERENK